MPKGQAKIFECLLCRTRYSKVSIDKGDFYVATGVCKNCYTTLQAQPASKSCFGKLPQLKLPGYNSDSLACSTICPDRTVCAQFISKLKRKG